MRADVINLPGNGLKGSMAVISPDCIIFNPKKRFPKCKCGRFYVPIHKGDKRCIFCL